MSTQTAVRQRIVIPPTIAEMVGSLTEDATATVVAFDRRRARANDETSAPAANTIQSTHTWSHPTRIESTSRAGKSGILIAVALLHVTGFYALTQIKSPVRKAVAAPLLVVTIAEPQNQTVVPPPPVPHQYVPEFVAPVEPVIVIASAETNAITVAAKPTETTATPVATNGAPKIVSSVEYVREPAAKYPSAARALKQRGTVMLRALIDITGHAQEVNVHRSSGHRLLDDAARNAVLTALFKPYTENGHTLPVYVFIPIEFGTG